MTGDDEERKQNAVNMEQDMSSSSCAAKMHEISDGQLQMLLKNKTKIMSTDLLLSKLNETKKEAQGYKTTINIQKQQITELEKHLVSSNLDYKILQCEHSKLNDVSVKLVALEQQNQQLSALLEQRNSQLNKLTAASEDKEAWANVGETKFSEKRMIRTVIHLAEILDQNNLLNYHYQNKLKMWKKMMKFDGTEWNLDSEISDDDKKIQRGVSISSQTVAQLNLAAMYDHLFVASEIPQLQEKIGEVKYNNKSTNTKAVNVNQVQTQTVIQGCDSTIIVKSSKITSLGIAQEEGEIHISQQLNLKKNRKVSRSTKHKQQSTEYELQRPRSLSPRKEKHSKNSRRRKRNVMQGYEHSMYNPAFMQNTAIPSYSYQQPPNYMHPYFNPGYSPYPYYNTLNPMFSPYESHINFNAVPNMQNFSPMSTLMPSNSFAQLPVPLEKREPCKQSPKVTTLDRSSSEESSDESSASEKQDQSELETSDSDYNMKDVFEVSCRKPSKQAKVEATTNWAYTIVTEEKQISLMSVDSKARNNKGSKNTKILSNLDIKSVISESDITNTTNSANTDVKTVISESNITNATNSANTDVKTVISESNITNATNSANTDVKTVISESNVIDSANTDVEFIISDSDVIDTTISDAVTNTNIESIISNSNNTDTTNCATVTQRDIQSIISASNNTDTTNTNAVTICGGEINLNTTKKHESTKLSCVDEIMTRQVSAECSKSDLKVENKIQVNAVAEDVPSQAATATQKSDEIYTAGKDKTVQQVTQNTANVRKPKRVFKKELVAVQKNEEIAHPDNNKGKSIHPVFSTADQVSSKTADMTTVSKNPAVEKNVEEKLEISVEPHTKTIERDTKTSTDKVAPKTAKKKRVGKKQMSLAVKNEKEEELEKSMETVSDSKTVKQGSKTSTDKVKPKKESKKRVSKKQMVEKCEEGELKKLMGTVRGSETLTDKVTPKTANKKRMSKKQGVVKNEEKRMDKTSKKAESTRQGVKSCANLQKVKQTSNTIKKKLATVDKRPSSCLAEPAKSKVRRCNDLIASSNTEMLTQNEKVSRKRTTVPQNGPPMKKKAVVNKPSQKVNKLSPKSLRVEDDHDLGLSLPETLDSSLSFLTCPDAVSAKQDTCTELVKKDDATCLQMPLIELDETEVKKNAESSSEISAVCDTKSKAMETDNVKIELTTQTPGENKDWISSDGDTTSRNNTNAIKVDHVEQELATSVLEQKIENPEMKSSAFALTISEVSCIMEVQEDVKLELANKEELHDRYSNIPSYETKPSACDVNVCVMDIVPSTIMTSTSDVSHSLNLNAESVQTQALACVQHSPSSSESSLVLRLEDSPQPDATGSYFTSSVAKPMLHNLLRLISESTFDLEDTVCQMQQWYTSSSLASIAEALLVAVANISKKENDLFISGFTLTKTQFNVIKLIVKLETTSSFVGIIDAIIKTMPFCITDCKTNSLKSATSLSALTRVFVYLCRMKHRIQPVRNLVYQVMCEMYSESSIVVYEAVTAWPILIPEVNENTANSLTDLKILPQCLVYVMLSYDADKNIHDKYKVPQLFDFLSLKFHFQRGERSSLQLLQHISDRLEGGEVPGVKSGLLLLCYCESVAWRKMLIVFLIPIVMKYATSPVADQAAQVAAKVIGQVAHTFLLSKTSTVSQIVLIFKMLLQQLDISAGLRQQLQMSLELLQPGSNKQ